MPDSNGLTIEVFGAAQNASTGDPSRHMYLYTPPLRFVSSGEKVDTVVTVDRQTGIARVTFFREGISPTLPPHISAYMRRLYNVSATPPNIRPLQYSFLELTSVDGNWSVRIPQSTTDLPSLSERIPVSIVFGSVKELEEFIDELNGGIQVNARIGYGGYKLVRNLRTLTTSDLRQTNFIGVLQGPSKASYVTREQIRQALAFSATRVDDTWYLEDPNLGIKGLEWFDNFWSKKIVSWDDFLDKYLAEVSRYSFNSNDLTPDKFNKFEQKLKKEMEDETKDYIEIEANFATEAGFLNLISGKASGGGRLKKEDFDRHRRMTDASILWEGEAYVPKSIELYSINADAMSSDDVVVSKTVGTISSTAVLSHVISSSDRVTPDVSLPVTCQSDVERRLKEKATASSFLAKEQWFRRDRQDFEDKADFLQWLSSKPRLVIEKGGSLTFDMDVNYVSACEVVLQDGALVSSPGPDIKFLTLNFVSQGGQIKATPPDRPSSAGQVAGAGNLGRHFGIGGRKGCGNTEDGGRGEQGGAGVTGESGHPAPNFVLGSLFVTGGLKIELTGGKGGQGGTGGVGGRGGDGLGASSGSSSAFDCKCGGHPGGRGGDGGPGGLGGRGGSGGAGGNVVIITVADLPTTSAFTLSGGLGGDGGPGGTGGAPGSGGNSRKGAGYCSNQRGGNRGSVGGQGTSLGEGANGPSGSQNIDVLVDGRGQPNFFAFWQRVGMN